MKIVLIKFYFLTDGVGLVIPVTTLLPSPETKSRQIIKFFEENFSVKKIYLVHVIMLID
jgi:hypothetical protein